MEDVRAVAMHQDAVRVEMIVGIAANVPAPIDDKHTLPEDRRDSLGKDRARETRPDNQPAMHARCHSTRPIALTASSHPLLQLRANQSDEGSALIDCPDLIQTICASRRPLKIRSTTMRFAAATFAKPAVRAADAIVSIEQSLG